MKAKNEKPRKRTVVLNEDNSINRIYQNHGADGVEKALNKEHEPLSKDKVRTDVIETDPGDFQYLSQSTLYIIKADVLRNTVGEFNVSLHATGAVSSRTYRDNVNLYSTKAVERYCEEASERIGVDFRALVKDLDHLIGQLDDIRREKLAEKTEKSIPKTATIAPKEKERAMEFLRSEDLVENINERLGCIGIVGEVSKRIMLWLIALSYKLDRPLHAVVQGGSGSGKSHMINEVASSFPPEDLINVTRITSKSLYHFANGELIGKLIIVQDFDGLDEEAFFAFREMQTAQKVSSMITEKNKLGNQSPTIKDVKVRFASLGATTKSELYFDNMSRSVILGVDESIKQTKAIIAYQNKLRAGKIDKMALDDAKRLLQNVVRLIEVKPVINPYADCIELPVEAKMPRRLNAHFQTFIEIVTILHQHQRECTEDGEILTTIEDIKIATELFFDAIMLKVDELDSSTRQFFERLKDFIADKGINRFTLPELRRWMNMSKTQVHTYITRLRNVEYVKREGTANKGYTYWISLLDEIAKTRKAVKNNLKCQIEQMETEHKPNTEPPVSPEKDA